MINLTRKYKEFKSKSEILQGMVQDARTRNYVKTT